MSNGSQERRRMPHACIDVLIERPLKGADASRSGSICAHGTKSINCLHRTSSGGRQVFACNAQV